MAEDVDKLPTVFLMIESLKHALSERAVWVEVANFLSEYMPTEHRKQPRSIQTDLGPASSSVIMDVLEGINDQINVLDQKINELGGAEVKKDVKQAKEKGDGQEAGQEGNQEPRPRSGGPKRRLVVRRDEAVDRVGGEKAPGPGQEPDGAEPEPAQHR
jgi:hypothetical protein